MVVNQNSSARFMSNFNLLIIKILNNSFFFFIYSKQKGKFSKICILFLLLLPLSVSNSFAQYVNNENSFFSDIRITGKLKASQLLSEIKSDFSGGIHEFDNQPGLGFGIELSKQLSANWEIGAEFSVSNLHGETNSPNFSAIGYHGVMKNLNNEPVVYNNQLMGPKAFAHYNFFVQNGNKIHPFLRIGLAYLSYKAELKYKEQRDGNIIFGKAVDGYDKYRVSNIAYFVSPGIRAKISADIELVAAADINLLKYDFLDVVHNYDEAGNRQDIMGLFADFMVGITYHINSSGQHDIKTKRNKRKSDTALNYLPFYKRKK